MSGEAAGGQGVTVVKLGGSYAFSPRLPGILAAIEAAAVPVVLVPGGGPFADAVREAQPRMGFDDRAAHRMALLAMAQFAEALTNLSRLACAGQRMTVSHPPSAILDAALAPLPSSQRKRGPSNPRRFGENGTVPQADSEPNRKGCGVLGPRFRGDDARSEGLPRATSKDSTRVHPERPAKDGEEAMAGEPAGVRSGNGLVIASNLAAIGTVLDAGETPVWSPWPMADGLEALPESWDLTSDSLSAWLAARLDASRLLLLKHREPPGAPISFAEAAETGVVDPYFREYAGQIAPSPGSAPPIRPLPRGERAAPCSRSGTVSPLAPYSPLPSRERAAAKPPGEGGSSKVMWLGPSHLGRLTAILDGHAEAGAFLHPALPA